MSVTHRIREIREAKGWSQERLARAVGLDPTAISKIENGTKRLRADEMVRMAQALNVDAAELLGVESGITGPQTMPRGLSDDAVPYVVTPGDPFAGLQTDNRYLLLTVTCDSLDALGIKRGDIVVVDGDRAATDALEPLQCVRVQYHANGRAVTLLRQFVPPSLVVTNSLRANSKPINIDTEDAQILGVIKSVHRALKS